LKNSVLCRLSRFNDWFEPGSIGDK
jgi:hypothetical protein